jgi:hypothetical protein
MASFNSLIGSLRDYNYTIDIIGDELSQEFVDFFLKTPHVTVHNLELGHADKSIIAALDKGLEFNDDD